MLKRRRVMHGSLYVLECGIVGAQGWQVFLGPNCATLHVSVPVAGNDRVQKLPALGSEMLHFACFRTPNCTSYGPKHCTMDSNCTTFGPAPQLYSWEFSPHSPTVQTLYTHTGGHRISFNCLLHLGGPQQNPERDAEVDGVPCLGQHGQCLVGDARARQPWRGRLP